MSTENSSTLFDCNMAMKWIVLLAIIAFSQANTCSSSASRIDCKQYTQSQVIFETKSRACYN